MRSCTAIASICVHCVASGHEWSAKDVVCQKEHCSRHTGAALHPFENRFPNLRVDSARRIVETQCDIAVGLSLKDWIQCADIPSFV